MLYQTGVWKSASTFQTPGTSLCSTVLFTKNSKWYDLTLLENIVNKVGANECKRNLEDYKVYLKGYISSRMIEDTSNSDVSPVYRITIDAEWDSAFMKEEEAPKNYLAHLLNVQEDFLFFDPCLAS